MKSTLLRALFSSHIVLTRTICLFAGCGFLACASLASADQFGNTEFPQVHQPEDALSALLKGVRVFQSPGVDLTLGLNNSEPTIAVDPNNPLHIAVATYLSLRVSVDGGNSFLPAVGAGVPPTHRSNRGGDSSLAFDSRGRLFWTYLLVTNGVSASAFDVFIAQCNPTTGALLPGYPVNVTASTGVNLPAPANCHDKEWLAIDCHAGSPFRDRIYIAWTQFLPSSTRVMTTASGDQGANWGAAVQVSGGGEGFVWPCHNTVGPNGDVYVGYHSQTAYDSSGAPNGTSGTIYVLRSTDGGATYPQKTQPFPAGQADLTFNRQSQNGSIAGARFWLQGSVQPWILADPITAGRIYVVANDDPDNAHGSGDDAAVFIATSSDFGVNWGAPTQVDSGPGTTFQVMPTAAIDKLTGCITVHYYDNRRGLTNAAGRFLLDVFATRSTDGGVTFSPDFRINDTAFDPDAGAGCRFECGAANSTTRIGEYNGVAIAGDVAFAVWTGNTVDGSGNPLGQQTIFDRYGCTPCLLSCPASVTVDNQTDLCGAAVAYSTPATSGGCGVVTCSPASGAFFPVGATTVTCTAGTGASCTFTVTVRDAQAPAITCPANIVQANDPGLCSAVVFFFPMATDNCPGVTVACTPPSGSVFPKGTNSVTCVATDSSSNQASCSFTVIVLDKEPPKVSCVPTTNPGGKNTPKAGNNPKSGENPDGFFQLLATDNCDPNPKIYVKDSASSFIAGPFANGDKVKIVQAPGGTPRQGAGPGVMTASIHLKGDALVYGVDVDLNISPYVTHLVPPGPK